MMGLVRRVLDYVISGQVTRPGQVYVRVDGELINLFREKGYGSDFARLILNDVLKQEFEGESLYIHIVRASTGRHVAEPQRTWRQRMKERAAARDLGYDWQPSGPLDEMANPNVRVR